MARIRTIKPEFFRHLDLFKAEKESGLPLRVAYAGIWCVADREGRFRWQPEVLKLDVLPFDDVDFSRVLDALMTCGFIVKYEIKGKAYGVIPSFKEHQIINNRERPSVLPSPDEKDEESNSSTRDSRVTVASSTPLKQDQGEREREKEKEKEMIKAFCPEPEKSGTEPEAIEAVLEIPIIGNGRKAYPVTAQMIAEWQETYPGIDVEQAIRECRQWNIANPARRKTKSGIARHIVSWLQREQNRCGGGFRGQKTGLMPDRLRNNLEVLNEFINDRK